MVLGIDLGSSNTVAATIARDGTPVIIPDFNNKNEDATPSIILLEGNKALVGTFAKNLFQLYPDKELLKFFKRKFGTQIPVTNTDNTPIFSETAAAILLKKVIYDAKIFSNEPIEKCVITIPSHYNDAQRKSVIEAAKLADLELTTILDEPIAAAILYSQNSIDIEDELIMVYDLGGGTFDLTILTNSNNKIHVIAKGGISNLGGKEFDEIIEKKITETYIDLYNKALPNDNLTVNKIKSISEEIKIELNKNSHDGFSKWLYLGNQFFKIYFDKLDYTLLSKTLISKTETAVNKSLRSLGIQFSELHKIVLIGGASSSHLVYDYWKEKIDDNLQKIIYHQPLTSVAKGAAIYANSLSRNASGFHSSIELNNVSTYNIALKDYNSSQIEIIVNKNLPLPVFGSKKITINSNLQKNGIKFLLVQFFDQSDDLQELGEIVFNDFPIRLVDYTIEIIVENKANGTLGLKVKDSNTNQNIKFEFLKKKQEFEYDFDQQYKIINSYYINNIS